MRPQWRLNLAGRKGSSGHAVINKLGNGKAWFKGWEAIFVERGLL